MRNNFPIIAGFIIICITFSCNQVNDNRNEIIKFPESEELSGNIITTVKTQHIRTLRIIDSILVIVNIEGDYFFEYYNCNNFELIGKYGTKGKGPGEFLFPLLTGDFVKKSLTETIIQVYDWHRQCISYVDLHKSINEKSYACKSLILNNDLKNACGVIFISDSIIGMIPDHGVSSRFIIYNSKNHSINHIPFIPKLAKWNIHRNNQYYLYATGGYCVNQNQFFIAAPSGNGQLDFFDLMGNYLKTIHIRDNNYLKEAKYARSVMAIDGFNVFYSDLQIVNEEIYALFSIIKLPDLKKISESRIYVFDLEGNPKKEYILDNEIHRFAIDTVNKRFIGLLTNEGELVSFRYE